MAPKVVVCVYIIDYKYSISLGTCINNTSVMMFKKGSFEIGATVYPVAIKVRVTLFNSFF